MKRQGFQKMALLGLTTGLLVAHLADGKETPTKSTTDNNTADDEGNLGYHLMSEKELLLELNDEGTKTYMSLDASGKELARKVASSRCNGTNECKGLNACKTDKNSCAGKGDCKGQGKCAISDKNLAVQLVAKKMAEKRNQAVKQ